MNRVLLVVLAVSLSLVAGCGNNAKPAPKLNATAAAPDKSGCKHVDAPKPKPDGHGARPNGPLDAQRTNTVTFTTSCGAFTVTLDVKAAPGATGAVAELARTGFYNNTTFHRIVPGFVIQGGDPTGTGTGGPGYKTVDKPSGTATYKSGVVAMAKAGDEAPGTAGSQFFVVTAADSGLPPDYAIIGTVTTGMDTVKRIEALGTPSEQPSRPVVITKATFSSK